MACELILALDAPTLTEVKPVLQRVSGTVKWVKIGLEMFTACGSECVREASAMGFEVFLDLKLHDIPNTVAGAVEWACRLPISMLTIHTAGGREMMARALEAQKRAGPTVRLLGVTVLTSMDAAALNATGVGGSPEQQVGRLAALAVGTGLRGFVCSPFEIGLIRQNAPADSVIVTPGIRPPQETRSTGSGRLSFGGQPDDQSRFKTPGEAAKEGANFIVVGRPIFKAPDPVDVIRKILIDLG